MKSKSYITLDISRNCAAIVSTSHETAKSRLLFSDKLQENFIKKGELINQEVLTKFIESSMDKLENILGHKPSMINISLNDKSIRIQKSSATVRIENSSKLIEKTDVQNANHFAAHVLLNKEFTQIHAQPYKFILDKSKAIYGNPVGYEAEELSVDMLIYSADTSLVNQIKKVVSICELKISLFTPAGIGLGYESSSPMSLDKGVAVVDVAERETSINVYKKGCLIGTKTIDTGFYKIIKDIMICLEVDKETAITYFEKLACSMDNYVNKYKIHTKFDKPNSRNINFTNVDIINIVKARLAEISEKIEAEVHEMIKPDSVKILVTGLVANINSWQNIISEKIGKNKMEVYVPTIIGASDASLTAALGNSYFIYLNDHDSEICVELKPKDIKGPRIKLDKLFAKLRYNKIAKTLN